MAHGGNKVVVICADELGRLNNCSAGNALVAAIQASSVRETDMEPPRAFDLCASSNHGERRRNKLSKNSERD